MSALHVHQPEAADAKSLSDQATFRIRELIVTLELAPGSVVSERELMDRLGLGRTPVREALRTLAGEKLVEVYPRRGMFVSTVDAGDLASLSEVRGGLESIAARLAASRATETDRAALNALIAELDAAADEHDERLLIGLDQRIHRQIYACTHNRFLEATLSEYYVLALRIWFLALDRVGRLEYAIQEHRELLDAIVRGKGDRADALMRRHVERFEKTIRAVL
jgi:DNA-binding GntR family transcriptional regulator